MERLIEKGVMDLRDFYSLILRHLVTVIVCVLLGLAGGIGATALMTPMYQAQVQLFVSTPSSTLDLSSVIQGSSFSQQRVKSYAQIINGPSTLVPVINQLKLDIPFSKLSKRVKASAPLDTVLINVTVSDESASQAARIANAVGLEFSRTVNRLELAQNTNSSTTIKVSVVKSATIPTTPASPRPLLNIALGLILGLGLGVGIGIVRQIFDNTVKKEEDLGDVPLLAAIGFDESAQDKPLITQISRYHARTEAFRQLRTNIQYLKTDLPSKVISFTSALPGEGKTSTATNLAISFAQSGMRVALIEADMRRPKVSEYLGLDKKIKGLSELLVNTSGLTDEMVAEALVKRESEGINFLPSGKIPPNPAELLDSQRFDELIEILRKNHDYIFIDCPPALPVADASIIATRVDGTVIVTKAGSTHINQFLGVRESIANVGSRVVGAVLNMIPRTRSYGDYGYRYGYGYGRSYKYAGKYGPYGKNKTYDPQRAYAPEVDGNQRD